MATRQMTGSAPLGFVTMASALAGIVAVAVTIVVAATIALSPAPALVDGVVLGPQDDYALRHRPAPAQLGRQDDYGLRIRPAPAQLGPQDDYALRHGARAGD